MLVDGATGVLVSSQTGRRSVPRGPASESALRPQTTKETSLLPTVGLCPIVVSRPTWFAECAKTTSMNPTASTNGHIKRARSVA